MVRLRIEYVQLCRHSTPIRIVELDHYLAPADSQSIQNLLLGKVNLLNLMHVYEVQTKRH